MAKGYWIATIDVKDPEAYRAYVAANALAIRRPVADGELVIVEGYEG